MPKCLHSDEIGYSLRVTDPNEMICPSPQARDETVTGFLH